MHSALFQRLRTDVAFEIGSLEARLKQLLAEDYPTDAAPTLIRHLQKAAALQRAELEKIVQDSSADPDGALARLRSVHRKLVAIYFPFVVYIQGAQTRRVPWSLVPSIERLANFLHPNQRLLTTCLEEYNYRLIWSRLPNGETETDEIDKFDLLLIPSTQRLNVFLHVLVGHELFHPLLDDFLDKEQAQIADKLRNACNELLNSLSPSGEPAQDERLDRVFEHVRNLWRQAMAELICDLGCAYIFGPSALLAYVAISSSSDLDSLPTVPPYYPPSRLRIRKILEYAFGADGHGEQLEEVLSNVESNNDLKEIVGSFREYWSAIKALASDDSDLNAIASSHLVKLAYEEISEPLGRAWKFIASISGLTTWSWSMCHDEVPAHLRKLKLHVPCGEMNTGGEPVGSPSSLSAIMLAAWMNELHGSLSNEEEGEVDVEERYFRACRILLKSMEDSELKRVYQDTIAPQFNI